MPGRKEIERWLFSEEIGDDEAADRAFAQLFTTLPKVQPSAGFIDRTLAAALRFQAERRRRVALAWAAALAITVAWSLVAYAVAPHVGSWTIRAVAIAAGRSMPWLISYTSVALDWWWTVGRVGGSVAAAMMTPARATALVGVELVGIAAFLALQKLAREERVGDVEV